jgi:hypothetical protein
MKATGDGSLSSINSFYNLNGSLNKRDTLNQVNTTRGDLRGYNVKAVYTEPIWKRSLLEFSVEQEQQQKHFREDNA